MSDTPELTSDLLETARGNVERLAKSFGEAIRGIVVKQLEGLDFPEVEVGYEVSPLSWDGRTEKIRGVVLDDNSSSDFRVEYPILTPDGLMNYWHFNSDAPQLPNATRHKPARPEHYVKYRKEIFYELGKLQKKPKRVRES